MRVLLIYPPMVASERRFAISVGQPLGIAYLGAQLEQEGFEVHLLDALMSGFLPGVKPEELSGTLEPDRVRVSRGVVKRTPLEPPFAEESFVVGMNAADIVDHVRRIQPDVVGISVIFTSLYKMGLHIAESIKNLDPGIKVIMGGSHVTVSPENCLKNPAVDYIVLGEGEMVFPRLLKGLEAGKREFSHLPGVGYRDAQGKSCLTKQELIMDLDQLSRPAWHLLPMEDYFTAAAEGRTVKMYTSRGCTFTCSFCSVPYIAGRRFRVHSPERVMAEIEYLIETYAIEGLMFEDDNMNLEAKRARRIFEMIVERNFGLKMYARNFRCDIMDAETLRLMKLAGFDTVWITPESGNQRVLNQVIEKKMKLNAIRDSVTRMVDSGLNIGAAFVIGSPGETRDEIQDTIEFARELKGQGVGSFWISIATPIEGTRLYNDAMDMGLIQGMNLDRFSYNEGTFDTDEFTAGEMNQLRDQLMAELNA